MAKITIVVPDGHLWSQVFGSTFDSYPWWQEVTFDSDSEWNVPGVATLTIDDPDRRQSGATSTRVTRTVNVEALAEAASKALALGFIPADPERWDSADYADVIAQMAVLGEVVYG